MHNITIRKQNISKTVTNDNLQFSTIPISWIETTGRMSQITLINNTEETFKINLSCIQSFSSHQQRERSDQRRFARMFQKTRNSLSESREFISCRWPNLFWTGRIGPSPLPPPPLLLSMASQITGSGNYRTPYIASCETIHAKRFSGGED